MLKFKNRFHIFKSSYLPVAGILLLILLTALMMWYGNANSKQAIPAMVAGVYFDGEYRIADGEWQKIVEGEHISSTKGDVTPRAAHLLTMRLTLSAVRRLLPTQSPVR